MKILFVPRQIVMTSGVQALTTDYKDRGNVIRPTLLTEEISKCIEKHFANEGEECKADNKLNAEAIKNKEGRVVSSFTVNNIKLFVITDGLHLHNSIEYGNQYPLTTILLPEEY